MGGWHQAGGWVLGACDHPSLHPVAEPGLQPAFSSILSHHLPREMRTKKCAHLPRITGKTWVCSVPNPVSRIRLLQLFQKSLGFFHISCFECGWFVVGFFFWPRRVAYGILAPRPGIELVLHALVHAGWWTTREVPRACVWSIHRCKYLMDLSFDRGRQC